MSFNYVQLFMEIVYVVSCYLFFFQLLNELKKVNFTLDNQAFYFSTSGSFVNGYNLMNWAQKSNGQREFVAVGEYKLEQELITIDKVIQWYNSNAVSVVQLSRYV